MTTHPRLYLFSLLLSKGVTARASTTSFAACDRLAAPTGAWRPVLFALPKPFIAVVERSRLRVLWLMLLAVAHSNRTTVSLAKELSYNTLSPLT